MVHVNVQNYEFFTFCSPKKLVIRAGIHKIIVRIANREDTDQIAPSDVCLCIFGKQLVFTIIEHLSFFQLIYMLVSLFN